MKGLSVKTIRHDLTQAVELSYSGSEGQEVATKLLGLLEQDSGVLVNTRATTPDRGELGVGEVVVSVLLYHIASGIIDFVIDQLEKQVLRLLAEESKADLSIALKASKDEESKMFPLNLQQKESVVKTAFHAIRSFVDSFKK